MWRCNSRVYGHFQFLVLSTVSLVVLLGLTSYSMRLLNDTQLILDFRLEACIASSVIIFVFVVADRLKNKIELLRDAHRATALVQSRLQLHHLRALMLILARDWFLIISL